MIANDFWKSELPSVVEKVAEQKITPVIEEVKGKRADRKLPQEIADILKTQYGDEPFYNDLDGFITQASLLDHLVRGIREADQDFMDKGAFVERQMNCFSREHRARDGLEKSQIKKIFSWIYDRVWDEIDDIDPFSAEGAINRKIGRSTAEMKRYVDAKFEDFEKTWKAMRPFNALENEGALILEDCSEQVAAYQKRIRQIEVETQGKCQFEDALKAYTDILWDLHRELQGQPQKHINALDCALCCNIALCYLNLGNNDDAWKSLNRIEAHVAKDNAVCNFTKAALIVQSEDEAQYPDAMACLTRAIELEPKYYRAFSIRQYLSALMELGSCEENIQELDDFFKPLVSEGSDHERLGSYYTYRGLIHTIYDKHDLALTDFENAMRCGYDELVCRYNMMAARYATIVKDVPKGRRILHPALDYGEIGRLINELKQFMSAPKLKEKFYGEVWQKSVRLYLACHAALGIPHDLPVMDCLSLADDYETKRTLILGCRGELPSEAVDILDEDDQLYVKIRNIFENGDPAHCREEIERLMETRKGTIPPALINLLIQLCLIAEDPAAYWKYKELMPEEDRDFAAMDACAYELAGEMQKAKELMDTEARESCDFRVLENVLRFYRRNGYDDECETLYLQITQMNLEHKVYISDEVQFYQEGICFFTEKERNSGVAFFEGIPAERIPDHSYAKMGAILFSRINDAKRLRDALSVLCEHEPSFENRFNYSLCSRCLFRYDEALDICRDMLSDTTDEKCIAKLYWAISDLYLLKGDLEESYTWAEKAHKLRIENPFDRSHAALFGRGMRCRHREVIETAIEYQDMHPKAVDWIKRIEVPAMEEEHAGEKILQEIKNIFPGFGGHDDELEKIRLDYRKGRVSTYLALGGLCNGNWEQLMLFAKENKLRISNGNQKRQVAEVAWIEEDLVVDAQTLLLLAFTECLPALDCIQRIHITWNTVIALQDLYLSEDSTKITNLMQWLTTTPSIIFEPDGFFDKDALLSKMFSREFHAAYLFAYQHNIPLLCGDALVGDLQYANLLVDQAVKVVTIPALCDCFGRGQPERADEMRYSLLKIGVFISFSALTILQQVRKNHYEITRELMEPFLCFNSGCEPMSFVGVYFRAIQKLQEEAPASAEILAELVMRNAVTVWKRGMHYRISCSKGPENAAARFKVASIDNYADYLERGLKTLWEHLPECVNAAVEELHTEKQWEQESETRQNGI